jgi:hypothetical protein
LDLLASQKEARERSLFWTISQEFFWPSWIRERKKKSKSKSVKLPGPIS